jgi:hypothetical protein
MPLLFRIGLVVAVLALGAGVLFVGLRGAGALVGGIGSTIGGFIGGVTSTPAPSVAVGTITGAPSLAQPSEPYTAESNVDLVATVPSGLAGDTTHRIRVYLALPGQAPAPIQEVALAPDPKTVIPVKLETGINDFSVTIIGAAGESEHSAVVRYVFDNVPPKITITTPKNGATVNGKAVDIKGKTQARTTLLARNDGNGSSFGATAESDGTFALSVSIDVGSNVIAITGTDPAGNVTSTTLTVTRGPGKLTAALATSTRQIKRSRLPEPITLSVTVTDPDGQPLAGADVTFTLSIPGIPVITTSVKTGPDGRASFPTSIPKGATVAPGSAAVYVTTTAFGNTTDSVSLTVVQ